MAWVVFLFRASSDGRRGALSLRGELSSFCMMCVNLQLAAIMPLLRLRLGIRHGVMVVGINGVACEVSCFWIAVLRPSALGAA